MAIVWLSGTRISGLNADTKPTTVPANTQFFETDTDEVFNFNGTTWDKISIPSPYAAGDITSGVFNQARLGTGTGTSAKLLMGDTAWETFLTKQTVTKTDNFAVTSSTYADVTGLTLTLANRSGGEACFGFKVCVSTSGSTAGAVRLVDDGSLIVGTESKFQGETGSNNFYQYGGMIVLPLNGSVIKLQALESTGTMFVNQDTEDESFFSVLEIGGT